MGILRFILALSVVIAHATAIFGCSIVGSQVAVQSFYIISGFYMSLILNEKYIKENNSYWLFLSNRFLRLYPIYWCVLLLTLLYAIALAGYSKGEHLSSLGIYVTYFNSMGFGSFALLLFSNVFIFFQDVILFLGFDSSSGNLFFTSNFQNTNPALYRFILLPQAWTIALEMSFYFIAPFIVKREIKVVILLMIVSLLIRFMISNNGLDHDPWSYRFFPSELVFFLLGNLSYRSYKKIHPLKIKSLYLNLIFCTLILFTMSYEWLVFPFKMFWYFFCFFVSIPFVFEASKRWKWDAMMGELSYPIYISHLFILTLLYYFPFGKGNQWGITLSITTLLFSILLNAFVAKPIEAFRQKRLKKRTGE